MEEEGTLSNSFYEVRTNPDTKIRQRLYKKRKLQANIFDEHRYKNPQQNFSKLNSTVSYTVIIPGNQGWCNIHKSIDVIHHINKIKGNI